MQSAKDRLEAAKQRKADLQKEEADAKPAVAVAAPVVNHQTKMVELEVDGNVQRYQSAIESKRPGNRGLRQADQADPSFNRQAAGAD